MDFIGWSTPQIMKEHDGPWPCDSCEEREAQPVLLVSLINPKGYSKSLWLCPTCYVRALEQSTKAGNLQHYEI